MIAALMTAIGEAAAAFIGILGDIFNGVGGLFYEPVGGVTLLGYFAIIGVATALVGFAFNFILGLIRKIRAK